LGISIRVLAEPYLTPWCCTGWIGQDTGKGIELQGKIMPKARGKFLGRLTEPQSVTHIYLQLKALLQREGGWEKI